METLAEIERTLRRRFEPEHLEIRDESARHAGHFGATAGGGHFRVTIVSGAFEGLSRLDQHRLVNDALRPLFGTRIHALALRTAGPGEWRAGRRSRVKRVE